MVANNILLRGCLVRFSWKVLIVCMLLYQIFLTWHFTELIGYAIWLSRDASVTLEETGGGIAGQTRLLMFGLPLIVVAALGVVVDVIAQRVLPPVDEKDQVVTPEPR